LNFDLQRQLDREYEDLLAINEARLLWIPRQIGAIARWLKQSGHTSKAIEGAKALFREIQTSDCDWIKGFVAQTLSHAYTSLDDYDHALEWAHVCYSNWEILEPLDKAKARTNI
jgi:hypothetical protein